VTLLERVYACWALVKPCLLWGMCVTHRIRAAVCAEVSGKGDGGAETEEKAQGIHGDVDDGDAKPVDEGCWQEVEEGEEPPDADKEGVVDNRGYAVVGARNVVAHEGGNQDGAEQLDVGGSATQQQEDSLPACQARRPMDTALETMMA